VVSVPIFSATTISTLLNHLSGSSPRSDAILRALATLPGPQL